MGNIINISKLWEHYNNKLTENLSLNKNILREIYSYRLKSILNKSLINEFIGLTITIILIPFLIYFSLEYIDSTKIFLSGIISLSFVLIYCVLSLFKIKKLLSINLMNDSIIETQKKIFLLKTSILKIRKIEIILMPFLVVSLIPVTGITMYSTNLFEKPILLSIAVIIALIVSLSGSLWINKYIFDKKITEVELYLNKINKYENIQN